MRLLWMCRSGLLRRGKMVLVKRDEVHVVLCVVRCCCMLYVACCGQGFWGLVDELSKPLGARAGKISLPFSAERPIMKTGMPASFFLLSAESDMLRVESVKVGSASGESEISSSHQEAILKESDHPKRRGVLLVPFARSDILCEVRYGTLWERILRSCGSYRSNGWPHVGGGPRGLRPREYIFRRLGELPLCDAVAVAVGSV